MQKKVALKSEWPNFYKADFAETFFSAAIFVYFSRFEKSENNGIIQLSALFIWFSAYQESKLFSTFYLQNLPIRIMFIHMATHGQIN